MFVIGIGDVKSHEVGDVIEILQALRLRGLPRAPAPVVPEPPRLLPAPVKQLPAPAEGVSTDGADVMVKGGTRNSECGATDFADCADGKVVGLAAGADGREKVQPVTVNVMNVLGNGGKSGSGGSRGGRGDRGGHGKTLAAIRKKTDLIPGLVDMVDATPGRTAALVEKKVKKAEGCRLKVGAEQSALNNRGWAQQVAAGRERAVVRNKKDRAAIRAEVKKLMAQGFSQKAACEEVAIQARKGRIGGHELTTKYAVGEFEATPTVVRRVWRARW